MSTDEQPTQWKVPDVLLFDGDIRQAFPFLIPMGIIGVWRLLLFLIRVLFWLLYRPIHPKKNEDGSSANKFKSSDVTIIVPTIDNGDEFYEAAEYWLLNRPKEVIVVTSDKMKDELTRTCKSIDPDLFRVLSVSQPNKRVQMCAGINAANTPIVALSDDDAIWTPQFLDWCLAPFDDDKMGGVGSKQVMCPVEGYPSFWEVIADFRLTMRMIETSATTFVDGGMSVISGRTAIYRTEIVNDPTFQHEFLNETWLGKYALHSGDDKFITRWLVKNGWNMRMQNHHECCLQTTFKNDSKFLKQVLRWTRNTWRSDMKSIFVDHKVIWRYPYCFFNMVDKFINPLPVLWGLVVVIDNLIKHGSAAITYVLLPVTGWLLISRTLRVIPHIIWKPESIPYIPALILFQYYFVFAKVYALFTLHITDWGSRPTVATSSNTPETNSYEKSDLSSPSNDPNDQDLMSIYVDGITTHTRSTLYVDGLTGHSRAWLNEDGSTSHSRTCESNEAQSNETLPKGMSFNYPPKLSPTSSPSDCIWKSSSQGNISETTSVDDSINLHSSNSSCESLPAATPKKKKFVPWYFRPAVVIGAVVLGALIAALVSLGYTAATHSTSYWTITEVARNKALTSDRATGVGLFDTASNKTFLAYAGPNVDPYVMEYDHNIGEFVNRARVAYAKPLRDFHDYPKMVMADDGRLVIVYTDSPATLHVTKARDPHTSFGVWDDNQINSDNPSYPCLIKASNGDLYTFYRSLKSPTDYRPLHYVKSTDHGESWSEPRVAIDSLGLPVNGDPQNLNEVYSGCPRHEPATEYYQERFSMGWTIAGGGPGQVAHNFYHKNAHFAYFYPGKDTFAAVDGTDLGDFIDYDEFKQVEIFDSGPLDYENRRIVDYYFAPSTLDEVGNPIVVFNFNRTLLAGRWTGAHWEHSVVLEDAAYNCFDIEKLGHDTFRVFAAQGSVLVIFSHDGGKTWQREHLVTPAEGLVSKVIRVQNAHPDIQLVAHENDWSVYHSDADKEVNYIGTFRVWTMKEVFVNPVAHPYYPSTTSTGENDSLNPFYSSTTIANNGTATDVASQLQYLKDPEPDFDSNHTGDLFEEQEDTMWDVQHPSITPVPTPSSLPTPVLGYTVPPATTQGDIMEILEGSGDDPDVLEFVLNSPTSMPIEEEESKSNSQGEPPGPASHSYEYTTPPAATPGAVADIIGDNVGNRRRLSGKTTSNVGGYVKQGSSQNVHKDPYRSLAGSSMKTDFLHV